KGFEYTMLPAEPLVRIGLLTNASTVSITTSDTSLVAFSPDEPSKFLAATRVSVSARAYRPATVDAFHFELQNIETQSEAATLTGDIRESVGTTALASINPTTNKWRIWIGGIFDSIEEAEEFRSQMAAKGIDDLVLITEKRPSLPKERARVPKQTRTPGTC